MKSLPKDLRHLPPKLALGLYALGYKNLEDAIHKLNHLSDNFLSMSDPDLTHLSKLSTMNRVTLNENDFGLFALFASIAIDFVEPTRKIELESPTLEPRQLQIPGS